MPSMAARPGRIVLKLESGSMMLKGWRSWQAARSILVLRDLLHAEVK